jgi:hypothetical protein
MQVLYNMALCHSSLKEHCAFEMSGTTHPMAQCCILEELKPFQNKTVILSDRFMAVILIFIIIHPSYTFQHLHYVVLSHLLIWL